MNTIDELIKKSETRIFKAVFPNTTNHYETLFGGTALQLMDEVSFICATRFSRKKVVTISTGKIDFEKPIPEGTIIELVAKVQEVGRTSCMVKVDIYKEEMYNYDREIAVSGLFKFVAIDNDKKPIPIIDKN
ncbi:Acyl-CoA hydrolase [Aquimarina amphilecti]|uniref:Acyl-CoA hydrolase n=2 Tax=Aquimarina TaxID=290174 RepID=A0A1H7FMX9_AQUAM|nr:MULTISPECIES: acyl-CoA thioesterase [Aquimarina]AXT55637.1 acyl-CoA thioesterase [Aquimarina sp. AD1]MBQ4804413.1 acyl-CoA thioesterase [Aquimarina sp. MMG015]RKN24969.1 acyl-CoA thioesterase [Aquimarina sp. AD1]SEK25802.1 Acyl-CoA hydrolase [Aquimarina amphilecti]